MPFRHQTELFFVLCIDSANHDSKVPSSDIDSKVPLTAMPVLSGWHFCLVMLHAYPVPGVRLFLSGLNFLVSVKFNCLVAL